MPPSLYVLVVVICVYSLYSSLRLYSQAITSLSTRAPGATELLLKNNFLYYLNAFYRNISSFSLVFYNRSMPPRNYANSEVSTMISAGADTATPNMPTSPRDDLTVDLEIAQAQQTILAQQQQEQLQETTAYAQQQ